MNVHHVISPAYAKERQKMMAKIMNLYDDISFSMLISDMNCALLAVLGDHDDGINSCFMQFLSKAWATRSMNGQ